LIIDVNEVIEIHKYKSEESNTEIVIANKLTDKIIFYDEKRIS